MLLLRPCLGLRRQPQPYPAPLAPPDEVGSLGRRRSASGEAWAPRTARIRCSAVVQRAPCWCVGPRHLATAPPCRPFLIGLCFGPSPVRGDALAGLRGGFQPATPPSVFAICGAGRALPCLTSSTYHADRGHFRRSLCFGRGGAPAPRHAAPPLTLTLTLTL